MVIQTLDQWSFTAPFEGQIPHLYKDTAGLITAGVGFMFPTLAAAQLLPWSPSYELAADWVEISQLPGGRGMEFYRRATRARLTDDAMRAEFAARMADFGKRLTRAGWPIASMPAAARVAVLDMGYNLGVSGLEKFAQLKAAVLRGDWATAAAECRRKGVQPARNEATRQLFLSLV